MKHSRSGLFLMEMIIALFFFSMASAVCVQLFGKANLISKSTVNENNAITVLQTMAETWLSSDGDLQATVELLDNCSISDNGLVLSIYFDSDWNCVAASSDAKYVATLSQTNDDGNLLYVHLDVSDTASIYSLDLVHHVSERRGDNE